MNKELYIKTQESKKELLEIEIIVNQLSNFLKENESNFKKEKSILALKKIKLYLEIKEKELEKNKQIQKNLNQELYHTCKHEISIKRSNIPTYQCLVCDCSLDKDRKIIAEQSLIRIDTTDDYEVAYIIEDAFQDIVHSDKNLIETIDDLIEDLQYERKIKVYRR